MWYKIDLSGSDFKYKSNSVDLYYSLWPHLIDAALIHLNAICPVYVGVN
jgi:hypothetical protein